MVSVDSSAMHRQARELLQGRADPKKLVLIHTAVALGSSLLITLLNYLLSLQIADTGGLSGLGMRSVLSTIQSVLELGVVLALPFWEIGLIFAVQKWVKGENAGVPSLLQGFRRFGTVLAYRLLYGGLFFALGFAILQLSSVAFMLTPFATPLIEKLAPVMDPSATVEQIEALLTPEMMTETAKTMTPLFILFGILFFLVAIPFFYRLRFSKFAVMEGMGAAKAMLESVHITRKNTLQLVKVDLHFWWFYLLQVLCLGLSYADTILAWLGIRLPLSQDAGFFLFYILGAVCQGVLLWQYQAQVLSTYRLAYNTFGGTQKNGHESKNH